MTRPWVAAGVCIVSLLYVPPAFASHGDPLRAQWSLDSKTDAAQDVTPDSSGHGLDATSGNIELANDGRFGGRLGDTNAPVLTAGSNELLRPASVTLLAWVRRNAPPSNLRYIAGQGDDGGICNGSSYALYTGTGGAPGLQFYIRPIGDFYKPSPAAGPEIWDGQWHLVAGSFDGATVRLFVDGIEVGSGRPAPGALIDYGFSSSSFYIDGYPPVGCGSGDFDGGIDEVRVYGRALNRSELRRMAIAPGPEPPALEPDGDDDFVPDNRDNCPTVPNPDQRDSDGNGLGDGCEGPPVARFVYAPDPTCVGIKTQFNATNATAGRDGPIVRYEWTYPELVAEFSGSFRGPLYRYRSETRVISDGPSPIPVFTFGWSSGGEPYQAAPGVFKLTPAERAIPTVTLTITDSAGGSASVSRPVFFDQRSSDAPRRSCPPPPGEIFVATRPTRISLAAKSVTVRTTCRSRLSCAGSVVVTSLGRKSARAGGAARRRPRARVLAKAPYQIPTGASTTVRAPFTKLGRRLLRQRGRLRVKVLILSMSPTGKTVTRARKLTLKHGKPQR